MDWLQCKGWHGVHPKNIECLVGTIVGNNSNYYITVEIDGVLTKCVLAFESTLNMLLHDINYHRSPVEGWGVNNIIFHKDDVINGVTEPRHMFLADPVGYIECIQDKINYPIQREAYMANPNFGIF